MIKAYYSIGCNSEELFKPFRIAGTPTYRDYLNRFHVLHIDMATFLNAAKEGENPVDLMNDSVLQDFRDAYPEIITLIAYRRFPRQ